MVRYLKALSAVQTLGIVSGVLGQTSLYIPGFDPQPVSADIAGVDHNGRTTWLLHKGAPTDGSTPPTDFRGTATLVEGPQGVSFTYSDSMARFAIGQECTFSDQFAVCTIVAQGSTATQTEFVTPIEIQGGRTLTTTSEATLSSSTSASTPSSSARSIPDSVSPSLGGTASETNSASPPSPFSSGLNPFALIPSGFTLAIFTSLLVGLTEVGISSRLHT